MYLLYNRYSTTNLFVFLLCVCCFLALHKKLNIKLVSAIYNYFVQSRISICLNMRLVSVDKCNTAYFTIKPIILNSGKITIMKSMKFALGSKHTYSTSQECKIEETSALYKQTVK